MYNLIGFGICILAFFATRIVVTKRKARYVHIDNNVMIVLSERSKLTGASGPTPGDLLWVALSDKGFKRNRKVLGHIVPLYNETAKLVVDVEHTHVLRSKEDSMLDNMLSRAGIKVLRFPVEIVNERLLSVKNTVIESL